MSELGPIDAQAQPAAAEAAAETATSWHVRTARGDDVPAVVAAVEELLLELGGKPAGTRALEEATRALLADRDAGALLVAQSHNAIVGVLGASWQTAIHAAGRYALIQELWVHPSWRSHEIGSDLLTALFALARERQISRVEVGLPQESFAGIVATEVFYRRNGFAPLGSRMRWERS
jgi:branched-chain amino acid aminotransferase